MLASSRKPCGGGDVRGRIWNPPLRPTANVEANRETTNPAMLQTNVGDDACIVPQTLRRRKVPILKSPMCGGRERPPYGKRENIETNQENTAPQGPAGGPWPSPTNHGERPANRCGLDHPGDRRAGCPHPAGPCGGGDVYGLIWPPCQRGRKRRSGDCVERSRRSREPQFKKEEFLRHAASLKRHLAVRQSLRHGLRPCHLPLTREAKRCG